MNLLNYIDRYLVTALLPEIQQDLRISDSQCGLLGTAFMVVYFLVSPIFGWLGDRVVRPRLLGLGVAVWSLATAAAGMVHGYRGLFMARAAVGIGEAAYGTIAPSLITDSFDRPAHGRRLALFYLATPTGSAIGYLLGGALGTRVGWRPAFLLVGLPGLLLAAVAFALRDPVRSAARPPSVPLGQAIRETYATLWRNGVYVGTVAGYTAYTFALGGLAFWVPTYMMRVRGYPQELGMRYFGGITVVTGIVGTLVGGWLGDRLLRITSKGYTWVSVIAMATGGSLCWAALHSVDNTQFIGLMAAAQLCLFLNTGPVNALIVGSVPQSMRGSAMATSIFCIHLFGDAASPWLIGRFSDTTNLATAMQTIPAVFFWAGVLWATGLMRRRTFVALQGLVPRVLCALSALGYLLLLTDTGTAARLAPWVVMLFGPVYSLAARRFAARLP
jgi:predicted MFS family arabinose efflux permease